MIALLAALALAPDAHACSPGMGVVIDQSPAQGQEDVPRDAVIQLQLGDGYLMDEVDVAVTIDGAPVSGVLESWRRAEDLVSETGLMTFVPDEALPADAEVRVELMGIALDDGARQFSFQTGSDVAGEGGPEQDAPVITSAWVDEYGVGSGAQTSCDVETWRELDFVVQPHARERHDMGWLVLYRVGMGDGADAPFAVAPLAGGDAVAVSTTDGFELDRDLVDECFYAVTVNAAGHESEPSEIVCAGPMPELVCGTGMGWFGCSTTGLPAGLLAGLLGFLGMAGRRRR